MLLAAGGLVLLMLATRIYRSMLPPGVEAGGGCGFWLVCGGAVVALVGGAIWTWRREDE